MNVRKRVVIDTSTLIGAMLRPISVPRQAFLAAVGMYELCVSNATLDELQEVLRRRKFDKYVPLQERLEFFALLIEHSCLWDVDPESGQMAIGVCRDTKDDKFLALALSCRAVALISSDTDLQVLHPWQRIPIVTPSVFLERVNVLTY